MENKVRSVTRVINAREVFIRDGKMRLEPIGFDAGSGYVSGGYTVVELKEEKPKFYSSADSGAFLYQINYFIGEVTTKWSPKITNRYLKAKRSWNYDPYRRITDDERVKEQQVEGFKLYLPGRSGFENLFNAAVENKEKIREWVSLWFRYESTRYCAIYGFHGTTYEDAEKLEIRLDELYEELRQKNLTLSEGQLVNPQYLFIIPEKKVKRACYNRAKKFGIDWITPNVCLADNEEDFLKLMKSCYGTMEVIK